MKKFLGAVAVTLGILSLTGASNADGIKEGKWSMTITTKVAGMESHMAEMQEAMANMSDDEKAMMQKMMGGQMPGMGAEGMTTTTTQCITNDDPVPQSSQDEGCTSTHEQNGNTVHFETTCPESTSTGDVTYNEDSMSGTIQSHSTADGEAQDVTIEISGEYVGPCTDS